MPTTTSAVLATLLFLATLILLTVPPTHAANCSDECGGLFYTEVNGVCECHDCDNMDCGNGTTGGVFDDVT